MLAPKEGVTAPAAAATVGAFDMGDGEAAVAAAASMPLEGQAIITFQC